MKIGKLDSIYHFIKNNSTLSTNFVYVKTEEQLLFGVYIDGNIDNELKEKIKLVFKNIKFFEIEIGYEKSWVKLYLTLKEKAKKGNFYGTIIFGKDELIQEKFGTDIVEYDYVYDVSMIEEWNKTYMSDN